MCIRLRPTEAQVVSRAAGVEDALNDGRAADQVRLAKLVQLRLQLAAGDQVRLADGHEAHGIALAVDLDARRGRTLLLVRARVQVRHLLLVVHSGWC
ncbi:MAG: hypothetical protein ACR2H2_09805 [Solirubrobacteraceae bacterium]